ncbi:MAG: hypothetical protein JXX14_24120 [Deltaproteobacteria bacterium]|nr:hypothetical protein [Deltaproteobacteria bacterium]
MSRPSSFDTAITRVQHQHPASRSNHESQTAVTRIAKPNYPSDCHLTDESGITAIAVVHPETGTEVPEADIQTTRCNSDDDRTIIQPLAPQNGKQIRTEHLPQMHARANDDGTIIWNAGAHSVYRLRKWMRQYRIRFVIFSLTMSIAAVVLFVSRLAHTDEHQPAAQTVQPNVLKTARTPNTLLHTEIRRCTLTEAVTWLINGDYKNARAGYRFLSRQNPDNRAYAIALRILDTEEAYQ